MVAWQQQRYLDPGVWEHFQSHINPTALPADTSTLPLPVSSTEPPPLQLEFSVII